MAGGEPRQMGSDPLVLTLRRTESGQGATRSFKMEIPSGDIQGSPMSKVDE